MTSARVDYLYDIMDTAYAAAAIEDYSRRHGHRPVVVGGSDRRQAPGRRAEQRGLRKRLRRLGFETVETRLAALRSAAERIAGRLKEEFGAATSASAATPRCSAISASALSRSPPKTSSASPDQPQNPA